MKMTISFFPACFIIMLCALAFISMASEDSHVSRNIDKDSKFNMNTGENKFEINTKHFFVDVRKAQKGKGPYGGASILRQPRPYKNSAISLKQSSIFTSTTDVIFRLYFFLLVLPFVIP
ncbi:hypothetical protein A4A49_06144 [Nicotiana attenuata]|uniref:Transmembrane protein n=1 Tax=Nicotiana attenuata TaxID=49451 RepID=A0A1J6HV65_NICAT|nr:hypothetical protein A4A49_06144 [Nicotiana attenuata]